MADQTPTCAALPPRSGPAAGEPRQLAAPPPFRVRPAGEVRADPALCVARQPDSLAAQQYRLLRYKLKEALDPRMIGVTSPWAGDGKTVAAANLALALAEGRRVRVMLLDLNLREPALASLFGVFAGDGVAEQLRRKRRDPETCWDVLELGPRLHLLAGATPTENPAPLLNSEELPRLLSDLAEHYDYVVVDMPAVLLAAEVQLVQEQLDGLVLVARAGRSTRAAIASSIARLGRSKIHGVLMLEVKDRYLPSRRSAAEPPEPPS